MSLPWYILCMGRSSLLAAALIALATPALSETTLERIERTSTLRAGTHSNAPPFAFKNKTGELVGFSVDIISAIREALEKRMGKPIALDLQEVDLDKRLPRIQSGDLDIACDITTPTWEREEVVDFSVTIFFNGTRLLVDRGYSMGEIGSLRSPLVGVVSNSSTIKGVQEKILAPKLVSFPNVRAAFEALEAGEVNAIASTDVILRNLQRRSSRPGRYSLIPINGYLSTEVIACTLPENDSRWRDFTNHTIADLLHGVENYRGRYYEIYRKWFGSSQMTNLPLNKEAINHFKHIIDYYSQ